MIDFHTKNEWYVLKQKMYFNNLLKRNKEISASFPKLKKYIDIRYVTRFCFGSRYVYMVL